jgi:hypothetical protein
MVAANQERCLPSALSQLEKVLAHIGRCRGFVEHHVKLLAKHSTTRRTQPAAAHSRPRQPQHLAHPRLDHIVCMKRQFGPLLVGEHAHLVCGVR